MIVLVLGFWTRAVTAFASRAGTIVLYMLADGDEAAVQSSVSVAAGCGGGCGTR